MEAAIFKVVGGRVSVAVDFSLGSQSSRWGVGDGSWLGLVEV